MRPLRVYVGLNSAETVEDRAALALDEMIRVGAFDRSVLVVTVPTGTGWMDPAAMDTLEYLHGGDTAIVGVQYSYLTSWISLLVEPGFGTEHRPGAVPRRLPALDRAAARRPAAALPARPSASAPTARSSRSRLHEVIGDPFRARSGAARRSRARSGAR